MIQVRPYFTIAVLLLLLVCYGVVHAEYWFQSGAVGDSHTYFNNGASISIQSVTTQALKTGSAAFWVGENLQNGAFLQIGYLVDNASGLYPSRCTNAGCTGYENITAGHVEWFYEYFPSTAGTNFLGAIGPDGSGGVNGTFNNYGFYSKGNTWYFLFNGNIIGNVSLGTGSSGNNAPVAFAELANASTNQEKIEPVAFRNFSFYQNGAFSPVPYGYSYVGYGVGSKTNLLNKYGVQEFGNKVDYFLTGSNVTVQPNNTKLWSLGYFLKILSQYGNFTQTAEYLAYSRANFTVPTILLLGNGTRAVFVQWMGSGANSYSGASNFSNVVLSNNVTERVDWQPQFLLNVSSPFYSPVGSGWYPANAVVHYSLSSNLSYANASSRFAFLGWSNGQSALSGATKLTSPQTILAQWQHQFLLNYSTPYGMVRGNGWYAKNSLARISLTTTLVNVSDTQRIAFYSWSNGTTSNSLVFIVKSPQSLTAMFKDQYLTAFGATDVYGNLIPATIYLENKSVSKSLFIFSGVNYTINSAGYAGLKLPVNTTFTINSSGTVETKLPLYKVTITSTDLFGIPVNASTSLQFPNGTTLNLSTGPQGTILFEDVPYGSAIGAAKYGSISTPIQASYGNVVHLFFLSALDIGVFAAIIAGAVVMYLVASRELGKKRKEEVQNNTGEPYTDLSK